LVTACAARPLRVLGALRLALAVTVLAGAAAGCGGGKKGAATDATLAPGDSPVLQALPDCKAPPAAGAATAPPGIILPASVVIIAVEPQAGLIRVSGYIPITPGAMRAEVTNRPGVRVITSEDEVFEAEALLTDGTMRTFVKARATCKAGSELVALVAAETAPNTPATIK
jgi:hypothetical protein